jgi:hypothetical protein
MSMVSRPVLIATTHVPRMGDKLVTAILTALDEQANTSPRTGNRKLKRAFFLAAFAALSDPVNRAYYDRKRAEGKKHNAALICLARRHCDVIFSTLGDQPRPVGAIAYRAVTSAAGSARSSSSARPAESS